MKRIFLSALLSISILPSACAEGSSLNSLQGCIDVATCVLFTYPVACLLDFAVSESEDGLIGSLLEQKCEGVGACATYLGKACKNACLALAAVLPSLMTELDWSKDRALCVAYTAPAVLVAAGFAKTTLLSLKEAYK